MENSFRHKLRLWRTRSCIEIGILGDQLHQSADFTEYRHFRATHLAGVKSALTYTLWNVVRKKERGVQLLTREDDTDFLVVLLKPENAQYLLHFVNDDRVTARRSR